MRTYDLAGLQLWTFSGGGRKRRAFLLWDYAAERGYKFITRKEAASFLRTLRRSMTKVLDQ